MRETRSHRASWARTGMKNVLEGLSKMPDLRICWILRQEVRDLRHRVCPAQSSKLLVALFAPPRR